MEAFRKNMEKKQHAHYMDMQREMTAFILMNVETRKEKYIIEKLFAVDEIREVYTVHGNIDILAKVVLKRNLVSSDAEVIGSFVQETIRAIPGIASTHTLIPSISKKKE
jgi:DNA-binding Lrp family transcriptional regulator